jgi:hypothetical protein
MVTGIELPTQEQKQAAQAALQQAQQTQQPLPEGAEQALQAPTWEEVKAVMASDALRAFRVDIETDSTIQADLSQAQQNMSGFVEGLGAFAQAMGPAVQAGLMPLDIVADLLTGFARNFKLGRQAEDALERLGQQVRQPQAEKPDPEAEKLKMEQARVEQETAMKQQEMQARQQESAQKLQFEQAKHEQEMAFKREEMDTNRQAAMDGMAFEKRKFEGTEAGKLAGELDGIRAGNSSSLQAVEQAMRLAAEALNQIALLRQDMAQPKTIDVQRVNGKITGGVVSQGNIRSEVRLN